MTGLHALWIPILLSAVIVFVASSIIHMFLPWHRDDYRQVPNEDRVMDALRPFAIPPGDYMLPRPGGMAAMKSPEFVDRMNKGPVMMLTVRRNGMPGMTSNLVQWFIYSVVVSTLSAYVAGRALGHPADYLLVFRFVGATAFLSYSVALWQMSIWWYRSWSITIKATIDGLIYACLTAGTFGWLWPR